jgi:hypothetical protein
LSPQSKTDALNQELEKRLDELFSEQETPATAAEKRPPKADSPLAELKKIVLSIDWEITPDAVEGFLDQIGLLKVAFQKDKYATAFFQILGSLGQYIKSSRSRVHPNTFAVLNRVFAGLDEIVAAPGMSETGKRQRLQAAMQSYQELRDKISKRQAAEPRPAAQPPGAPAAAAARPAAVTAEELARAVAEIKAFVKAELDALRRELTRGGDQP